MKRKLYRCTRNHVMSVLTTHDRVWSTPSDNPASFSVSSRLGSKSALLGFMTLLLLSLSKLILKPKWAMSSNLMGSGLPRSRLLKKSMWSPMPGPLGSKLNSAPFENIKTNPYMCQSLSRRTTETRISTFQRSIFKNR